MWNEYVNQVAYKQVWECLTKKMYIVQTYNLILCWTHIRLMLKIK